MPGTPIHVTIGALRTTLSELEHQVPSDELTQLKRILLLRIAELESHSNSGATAKPLKDHR
jgi:hypothetical protein